MNIGLCLDVGINKLSLITDWEHFYTYNFYMLE